MDIRDRISSYLESIGFERRKYHFNRQAQGRLIHAVCLQKSQSTDRFTVECAIYSIDFHEVAEGDSRKEFEGPLTVEVAECDLRQRLGFLGPAKKDLWWPLREDCDKVAVEVIGLLEHYGIPFLDRFSNSSAIIKDYDETGQLPGMTKGRSALVVATLLVRAGQIDRARAILEATRKRQDEQGSPFPYLLQFAKKLGISL